MAKFCVKVLTLQEGMKIWSQKIHGDVPQSFLNLKMILFFHLESPKLKKGIFRVLIGELAKFWYLKIRRCVKIWVLGFLQIVT